MIYSYLSSIDSGSRYNFTRLHGVTSQKKEIFILDLMFYDIWLHLLLHISEDSKNSVKYC